MFFFIFLTDFVLEQTDVTALPVCRQGNDVGLCSLGLLVVVSMVGGAGCCELLVLGAGTLGCCGLVLGARRARSIWI